MKNLFLIVFLACCAFLKSQSYQPIITSGKQFSISWGPQMLGVDGRGYYYFDGDTLINGTNYAKLMAISTCRGCPLPPGVGTLYLAALLREDSVERKVYKYYGLPRDTIDSLRYGQEHLLYDFSVQVGDTVEMYNQYASRNEKLVIDSVTTRILANGDTAQDFHTNVPFSSSTVLYSTGIINSYYSFDMMMAGYWAEYRCVFGKNAQVLYSSFSANCDTSGYVDLEEAVAEENFTVEIYPNPSDGNFNLSCKASGTLSLYNLAGRKLLSLPITKTKQFVSVPGLSPGVYVWRYKSGNSLATGKLHIQPSN